MLITQINRVLLIAVPVLLVVGGKPMQAGLATATSITVTTPVGSNDPDPAGGYSDDVILDALAFGPGVVYTNPAGQFRSIQWANVLSGATSVNAEYGTTDDGNDGNPNPYVSAGIIAEGAALPDATRESSNPSIQNPTIAAAFNGFSLSQGIDGEGPDYVIDLVFDAGVSDDNDAGSDLTPEFIFFERGVNSDINVQLIVGGTLDAPILSPNSIDVLRGNLWPSGVSIATIEISPNSQQLGVAGLDLSDFFGANPVVPAYGVRVTSINGSGADLYGIFLSAVSPATQFLPVPAGLNPNTVPEPAACGLFGLGLLAIGWRRRSRSS